MGIARLAYAIDIGSCIDNSMPASSFRAPTLSRQRDQFRPVLKVHAVDVEPFGAPDEPVALENLADCAGHAVAPGEGAAPVPQELPVVGLLGIDIERCSERMR